MEEIKAHPWFAGVHWDLLRERKVKPPFVPDLRSDSDDSFINKVRDSTICLGVYGFADRFSSHQGRVYEEHSV